MRVDVVFQARAFWSISLLWPVTTVFQMTSSPQNGDGAAIPAVFGVVGAAGLRGIVTWRQVFLTGSRIVMWSDEFSWRP